MNLDPRGFLWWHMSSGVKKSEEQSGKKKNSGSWECGTTGKYLQISWKCILICVGKTAVFLESLAWP